MQETYINEICCQYSKIFLRAQNITEKISIKNRYFSNGKSALTDGFKLVLFIHLTDVHFISDFSQLKQTNLQARESSS